MPGAIGRMTRGVDPSPLHLVIVGHTWDYPLGATLLGGRQVDIGRISHTTVRVNEVSEYPELEGVEPSLEITIVHFRFARLPSAPGVV